MKAEATSQVEDMKQYAKMVIKRLLQYAHDVNPFQKQSTKGPF